MTSAESEELGGAVATVHGRGSENRWLGSFWRSAELQAARRAVAQRNDVQAKRLQRAEVALEFADRALEPLRAGRVGSFVPAAVSLYREAVYWALLAQDPGLRAEDIAAAWAGTPADVLLAAVGGSEDELSAIHGVLVQRGFVQTADAAPATVRDEAEASRAFVRQLIRRQRGPEALVRQVLRQRWRRTGLLIVVLAVVTGAAVVLSQRWMLAPDLALKKPWRTSSTHEVCHPEKNSCGGATTDILFHTKTEKDPWFEIDLGSPQTFSVLDIENRRDCCPDRAIPLIIEVSSDQQHWTQVARNDESFYELRMRFKPTTARYVRVRVPRLTALHLTRVAVRAH